MKNEQEKIVRFELDCGQKLSITHGYNIANSFPTHFHSSYNLGVVELGERDFCYRGERVFLKPNDIFIVQPFEPHSCISSNGVGHSYKVMSLQLDSRCYFPQLVVRHSDLRSMIREFHTLAEYDRSSLRLEALLNAIVEALLLFAVTHSSDALTKDTSTKISRAKHFIEANCLHDISLKEMSDAVCLSEYHFNRIFHKCYNLSPYAYYLICKVKKSQELLLDKNSVIDTAYDIGFFDQSHFTKLFKKHVGVTPGRYLRDNRYIIHSR
jgi:AraC-type DNA-binding domain-containing proteins